MIDYKLTLADLMKTVINEGADLANRFKKLAGLIK